MSRRRRPPALAAARRLAGPAALALAAARRVAGPATLAAVALAAGCQRVGGPHVNLQRMFVQPRYEPYGPSRFFADGKAMQLPPAGTVARARCTSSPHA